MAMETVFGDSQGSVAVESLRAVLGGMDISGTLYLGYPVLATADAKVFVDALLVSGSHGLVAFDLSYPVTPPLDDHQIEQVAERQEEIHASLYNKLNKYRNLRRNRSLAVPIRVVTCHAALEEVIQDDDVVACRPDALSVVMDVFDPVGDDLLRPLNAAIQRVSTLRPPKQRRNVRTDNSRGAKLKRIEKEIANLDRWQNRGAIEYTNGPQRIRGLAGSGKTIVLALKASYLHVRHPEWKIVVTFQTRSLYQQFRNLIRRFTYDLIEDEPDWDHLMVMHAWGSSSSPGVYSSICGCYEVPSQSWRTAQSRYGTQAFKGVCDEVNVAMRNQEPKSVFDAMLIDEAQDFPVSFYRMIYNVVAPPRRIIWAYDELQNLGDYEMQSEHELFGTDRNGQPLVTLRNEPNKPKEDIVLPVCYRNTPWALSAAHALGFGIYRPDGLVQMFEEPAIWSRIGYHVEHGTLKHGARVAVRRGVDSYPAYFDELLEPNDALQCAVFPNVAAQYDALAEAIRRNLHEDELDPTDILVVLPDAFTSRTEATSIRRILFGKEIQAHLVGVTTSADKVFQPGSVAITHIYRAKGNEAPMVYFVNADACQTDLELSRRRNFLFTGITRSMCWVRIFGVGDRMRALQAEVDEVRSRGFKLEFEYPDRKRLKHLAKIHRDRTDGERAELERKLGAVDDVLTAVLDGDLPPEAIPERIRKKLSTLAEAKREARG